MIMLKELMKCIRNIKTFYFSTGAGVTRSSHGVYHTIFDRNVSQSDQRPGGRVFPY